MKFLVLLAVVLLVLWLARGARRSVIEREREHERENEKPPPLPPHEEVVACSHCGLHLPRSDALPGRGGLFCSEAHRAAFEQIPR